MVLAPNAWDEDRETVQNFVNDQKLTYRVLLDGGDVHDSYHVRSVPALFWIDRAGVIRDIELGFHSAEALEKKTKRHLARG